MSFKSGFIAITGAPNVGKSTLLNRMLGEKISITSRKPQTTRNRILGVVHRPGAQLVFIDTPGIHGAKSTLNTRMVNIAFSAMSDVDLILLIADVSAPEKNSEKIVVERLNKLGKPVILALNKIDLVKKNKIPEFLNEWADVYCFHSMFPVSGKHGIGVDTLLNTMESLLPEGPPYFPEDTITDIPARFIAAEMIREKIFRFTGQEIPYSTAVTIDSFSERKDDSLIKIHATIHIERDSQKGILIGKGGSMLKKIGEEARKDIEQLVGTKVFLQLFVKVQKNWSKDAQSLTQFGY